MAVVWLLKLNSELRIKPIFLTASCFVASAANSPSFRRSVYRLK